ncbi:phosphopyruvate hydratase [Luteimicrobium xylanilyticum]|uniref:Enolase n=1 Tax=Luteimicrobium xylanilyticum TaxID=1133546 RepID=A0A5P9QDN6_9MICO|nr:phosphopyruvate hydratase [Luteimicrobium xylanilyticum]QFU99212.1 Phosphopyruvate hydratase [Luteimicrobium xylanilyticum]
MSVTVSQVHAVEILDSRSRPTLAVTLETDAGQHVRAGVPAGASTGTREAVELRDHDPHRYSGQGVLQAVQSVNGEILDRLRGQTFDGPSDLDHALIELDGTENKSRLGANAIVGVSIAAARAFAETAGVPLWKHLSGEVAEPRMPVPHFNVINGGVHALNELDFQEFMIAPLGAPSIAEAVRAGSEIYGALRALLHGRGMSVGLGDEGGFAPEIAQPEEALDLLVEAIRTAGYTPGRDGVAIAMDPASSEFYHDGAYRVAGQDFTSDQMIDRYADIVERYPVWLLEDGLAESDWDGWQRLTERLGDTVELVGDDIFCTNPKIIAEAITKGVGNASLIKVNQIGTVTETLDAMRVARDGGYAQFVSHRSGETEDAFIADLTVGSGSGHLKSGAPARGERVAKYARLVEIEDVTDLPYGLR